MIDKIILVLQIKIKKKMLILLIQKPKNWNLYCKIYINIEIITSH